MYHPVGNDDLVRVWDEKKGVYVLRAPLVRVQKYKKKRGIIIIGGFKMKKDGSAIQLRPPRNGYWEVVWSRKPRKMDKSVTGLLRYKETAEKIAMTINSLQRDTAELLIITLLAHGGTITASRIRENQKYRYHGCR